MENAGLVGLSRQVALQRALDVTANNIANMNTNGFKAENVVFEEFLNSQARDNSFAGVNRRVSFVADRATWHDLRQGPTVQTGNPLDLTIAGAGFLAVQTPSGERYTRNGALQINAAGELVTSEGYQVLGDNGPILLQPQDKGIAVGGDGTVTVTTGQAIESSQRGKVRIVEFENPGRLRKEGASLFSAPDGMQAQAATRSRIVQGSVEQSNVQSVVEMSRMVEITRAYTNLAQMIQNQSDMRRTAIERLAEIPA